MGKTYEGKLIAKDLRVAVVVSRFNNFITSKLLEGCLDAFKRHEGLEENIDIIWVSGSFEIPLAAKKMSSKNYDAVICLGALLRGDTPHFEYVSSEVTKGIAATALEKDIPISFGIITADTLEQAIERAGSKSGNKGFEAAMSAIEMANLFREL